MSTWPNGESYTGYRRNGEFTGWGTYIDSAGKQYRGFWFDGNLLFHKQAPRPGSQFNITGHGKRQYANYRYEGDFRDGIWEGYGVVDWNSGAHYEGEWKNDLRHGYGVMIQSNGVRYEGQWKSGKHHGHGSYTGPDHDFEGEFVNGKRHGQGVTRFKSGNVYEGPYENDKKHGKGVIIFANGTRLICTHENGEIVGEGEKYYSDGAVYKGELSHNGLPHGRGVWELTDGSRYEGDHDMGFRHGKGVLILPDGTRQEGLFEKDNYIGPEAIDE